MNGFCKLDWQSNWHNSTVPPKDELKWFLTGTQWIQDPNTPCSYQPIRTSWTHQTPINFSGDFHKLPCETCFKIVSNCYAKVSIMIRLLIKLSSIQKIHIDNFCHVHYSIFYYEFHYNLLEMHMKTDLSRVSIRLPETISSNLSDTYQLFRQCGFYKGRR